MATTISIQFWPWKPRSVKGSIRNCTTSRLIDVLNAQQDLANARSRQIQAQHDRVMASYTLLSSVGRLDVHTLKLNTPDYISELHYHQVRDAWHGVRTPSGQ
jgi:outer membrane protein